MEQQFLRWLRPQIAPHPQILVGIGDDAAILRSNGGDGTVVTSDMLMDGVDFDLSRDDPRRVGRKALAVNLSDLAAMAAKPTAAVISVALPRSGGMGVAQQLYAGILTRLAREFEVAIAGGDTNSWDGPLVISVTVMGEVTGKGPLLRSGAKPGDAILVTGTFGGSILGHHFDFSPRVNEAIQLHQRFQLHAGIDVSDGLSLDLARLADESGCGAEIDLAAIPISDDARRQSQQVIDGRSPLDHALADGEDFELILAVDPVEAERMTQSQPLPVPICRIGEFVAERGLWSLVAGGGRHPLKPVGYEHELT